MSEMMSFSFLYKIEHTLGGTFEHNYNKKIFPLRNYIYLLENFKFTLRIGMEFNKDIAKTFNVDVLSPTLYALLNEK